MPPPRLLSCLPLLLLLLSLAVVSVSSQTWYNFADSPEAKTSAEATQELIRLRPEQRTIAAAVNLCHKRSPDTFCAWIAVNNSDDRRPIAVSCFDEWHRQCNRRQLKQSVTGIADKYRTPECSLCSPCSAGDWPICTTCSRVCYCTCTHRRYESSSSSSSSSDTAEGDTGVYPCQNFCDGSSHCASDNDENSANCDYYKLGGSPAPEPDLLGQQQMNIIIAVAVGAIVVGLYVFTLHSRYKRYHMVMQRAQSAAQPLVAHPPAPPGSYPQQQQQQQQQPLPPPPAYHDVAA